MVTFRAIGVLTEPSKADGSYIVVVNFTQITTTEKGTTEGRLSQQRFEVASDAELTAKCKAVLTDLRQKHEQAAMTAGIAGKIIAEVTSEPVIGDRK